LFLAWTFLAPQGTEGSAEAAKVQYFEKAPQAFRLMALVAVWAIAINLWLIGGTTALAVGIGWVVGLVLFIAVTRSSNPRLHTGVVAVAWVLLIAEYIFELSRGVPTL
jgi:phosphoglycerol transferase MdoB-like AlkP superfamily enzyme